MLQSGESIGLFGRCTRKVFRSQSEIAATARCVMDMCHRDDSETIGSFDWATGEVHVYVEEGTWARAWLYYRMKPSATKLGWLRSALSE